jgi:hypothetical protein
MNPQRSSSAGFVLKDNCTGQGSNRLAHHFNPFAPFHPLYFQLKLTSNNFSTIALA